MAGYFNTVKLSEGSGRPVDLGIKENLIAGRMISDSLNSFAENERQAFKESEARRLMKLQEERESSASDAREQLRAEYELQSKLFSVQISPLVRIVEDKGLFSSEFKTEVGYQYQLLINGIPAFQPHVLIERNEVRKEVNEERIDELIKVAKQIAEGAIDLYLGANGQFAKLAMPIVKRLKA